MNKHKTPCPKETTASYTFHAIRNLVMRHLNNLNDAKRTCPSSRSLLLCCMTNDISTSGIINKPMHRYKPIDPTATASNKIYIFDTLMLLWINNFTS